MSGIELNKCAIAMGKIIIMLSELEPKIQNEKDVLDNKETFYSLAYLCRVGILDRIENNDWIKTSTPIVIPLSMFTHRNETIKSGFLLTVGKLRDIASNNFEIYSKVENILNKGNLFYEFEKFIPPNFEI
jgi:hypothetical protein